MKLNYKGFELIAERGGWIVSCSAFRLSDLWELTSFNRECSVREAMNDLKITVDHYHKNPRDYDEDYEDHDQEGAVETETAQPD